jgi:dTDP-D-glucose 4,6-dehydratase
MTILEIPVGELILNTAVATVIFFFLLGVVVSTVTQISKRNKLLTAQVKLLTYIAQKDGVSDEVIKNILAKYNPSTIFNLAAETHVDRSIDSPKKFINSNISGVFTLLETIREYKKKTKLIQISTDEVYGDIKKKYKSLGRKSTNNTLNISR